MSKRQEIYWVDVNRFDVKPDKSTWLEMGDALSNWDFDVHIVTSYAVAPYPLTYRSANILSLQPSRVPGMFRVSFLVRAAITFLKSRNLNAIYILPPSALFIAPLLKAAGLHNIHLDVRTPPVTVQGWKRRLDSFIFWRIALKFFSGLATSYSFITKGVQDEVERVSGKRFPKAHIWSSGASLSVFEMGHRKSGGRAGYNFFYHGTITTDRGVIEMVDAFGTLARSSSQPVSMTIVGAGPGTQKLVQFIDENGLGDLVTYVGPVPYEDVPALIQEADCCICPLPDRDEWQMSSPLKIFEYMASAKPIIATPILAHLNVLQDYEFVVWPDDFSDAAMVRAMAETLENRSRLASAATAGPDIIRQKYDWEKIGAGLAGYLRSLYG